KFIRAHHRNTIFVNDRVRSSPRVLSKTVDIRSLRILYFCQYSNTHSAWILQYARARVFSSFYAVTYGHR
ncbi:unnamed protein product, partial [Callosobruchus maculatus]